MSSDDGHSVKYVGSERRVRDRKKSSVMATTASIVMKESNEVFKSVLVERLQSFMALGQTKPSTFYTFLWTLFNSWLSNCYGRSFAEVETKRTLHERNDR